MTKTCKGPRKCAAMVRAAARRAERQGRNETDASMRRMYLKDAKDMLTVAARVARGDKSGANRKAQSMDTAARDLIPLPVLCWLGWQVRGGCSKGKKVVQGYW